ncbi:Fanconi anemia group J protein [Mortierella polycephala]|uniref:DNA 5'-3' helicase n=1 Tax=Mortierella polycephala TaxID=41804 RepID=A0A9P6U5U2_9FUNG|nr:Fanconi anemia group J protein [Mortierella polycephala]
MGKRNRILPPTLAKGKGKAKATSNKEGSSGGKQSRLTVHVDDSSDSDLNLQTNTHSDNEGPSTGASAKSGYFLHGSKRVKASSSKSTVSAAAAPTEFITGGVCGHGHNFGYEDPHDTGQDQVPVHAIQIPTGYDEQGSGKSLALLCGALAWLEAEKEKRNGQRKQRMQKHEDPQGSQTVVESPYFVDTDPESPNVQQQALLEAPSPSESSSTITSDGVSTMPAGCGSCSGHCGPTSPVKDESAPPKAPVVADTVVGQRSPVPSSALGSVSGSKVIVGLQDSKGDELDFQAPSEAGKRRERQPVELRYESGIPELGTRESVEAKETYQTGQQHHDLPKIYFGSRTHKQISQLVKELKSNTVYRPKMVVLGSRNHYCVNPNLKRTHNKNDACQELLDNDRCFYKFKVADMFEMFSAQKGGKNRIWDMEDLIKKGKAMKACPYFTSRSLALGAELIFCPYNYLIDPQIRKAMDIDLSNAIVILDEAHNIEDAARDAGGLEVQDEDLKMAQSEFQFMVEEGVFPHYCKLLMNLATMLLTILNEQTTFRIQEYEQLTEIWTSQEILGHLERFGLNRRTICSYDKACAEISRAVKEQKEKSKNIHAMDKDKDLGQNDGPGIMISTRVVRVMEEIVIILNRLLTAEPDSLDDYKIALVESVDRSDESREDENMDDSGDSDSDDGQAKKRTRTSKTGKRRLPKNTWPRTGAIPFSSGSTDKKKREFKFWCLNPGVIFRPLSMSARSVILTSGTLSPMDSFASELQTRFPIQLEADHVIDRAQVWAGVLPYGPTHIKLDGTYRSAVSFPFQDELGRVVERIIQTTPHGVLCFLSSYALLDNLMTRWRSTGQYQRFCGIKKVMQEPRRATNKVFDRTLKEFYSCISTEVDKGSDGGAILFAVFRGKCSEGIDFTDSNCRAVLAVSIPFPGMKDLKIQLKQEYNDLKCQQQRQQMRERHPYQLSHANLTALSHSTGSSEQSTREAMLIAQQQQSHTSRSHLSGKRWYEIQAFRAYNQAIGRCIRHRKDWGAMVLLDYRFTLPNNRQSLSKWVRPLVKTFTSFESGMSNMAEWVKPLRSGSYLSFPQATLQPMSDQAAASTTLLQDLVIKSMSQEQDCSSLVMSDTHAPENESTMVTKQEITEVASILNDDASALVPQERVVQERLVQERLDALVALQDMSADRNGETESAPEEEERKEAGDFTAHSGIPASQPMSIDQSNEGHDWDSALEESFAAGLDSDLDDADATDVLPTQSSQIVETSAPGLTVAICVSCGTPLLSCTERPKIKTTQKSMACELHLHRKRITHTQPGSSIGSSGVMILVISKSCIREVHFDSQRDAQELDCVWRPQDGLIYRRIICPRCCCVGGSTQEGMSGLTADPIISTQPASTAQSSVNESQRVIPGWKGVMIIGHSRDQPFDNNHGDEDGTQEVGTIWFTPGEIRMT